MGWVLIYFVQMNSILFLFLVQLEDDIIAVPNFVNTMVAFASQQNRNPWLLLEFSQLGFIGKLLFQVKGFLL